MVLNNTRKNKPRINITTKRLSRKQVILPMSLYNVDKVMTKSNAHIANINRLLTNVKSDLSADFMYLLWCIWGLIFFFFFYSFSLILYFFSFEFLFLFIDNEEAHDTVVTSNVTWGDVIKLRVDWSDLDRWH